MFDIGWTELLVIAVVLIVVVGPKDLPPMIRAFGKMTANFRKMAGDFRAQFDEALREADMDDVRKTISDAQKLNPTNALRDAINPLRQMGQDIKADLQKATEFPNPLAENASTLSPADAEAQHAIEGAEPVSSSPEVPPSVEPAAAATKAPAAAAAPVTQAPAVADNKAAGGTQTVAPVATAKAEPSAAKPRAPRKAPVKAEGETKARSRSVVILNAVPAGPHKETAIRESLRTAARLKLEVIPARLSDLPAYGHGLKTGRGVTEMEKNGTAAKEITALLESLWARDKADDAGE